jgi:hypothetical protein
MLKYRIGSVDTLHILKSYPCGFQSEYIALYMFLSSGILEALNANSISTVNFALSSRVRLACAPDTYLSGSTFKLKHW